MIYPSNATILLRGLDRLLREKDEEAAHLDKLRRNELLDTQRLREIERKIQEIRPAMRYYCSF